MIKKLKLYSIFLLLMANIICYSSSCIILGKLAQVLNRPSLIRLHPNTHSKILYKAKPYEYIIVKSCLHSGWLEVVMQSGMVGFIQRSTITELPYEVTQAKNSVSKSSYRSWATTQSLRFIGTPYKFGGQDFKKGIDCSSFVQKIYGSIGLSLPRTAAEQALVGTPIKRLEELQPGDRLYFWEKKRNKIGHTGLYLGNGFFVHASFGRKGIATDSLKNSRWQKLLVAARR